MGWRMLGILIAIVALLTSITAGLVWGIVTRKEEPEPMLYDPLGLRVALINSNKRCDELEEQNEALGLDVQALAVLYEDEREEKKRILEFTGITFEYMVKELESAQHDCLCNVDPIEDIRKDW